MFSNRILIYFIFTVWTQQYGYTDAKGPICLKCDRVQQPSDCTNVVQCGEHELCSVRKYLTDDGHMHFDVGCTDAQQCRISTVVFGRRRETTYINEKIHNALQTRSRAGEITECELCCRNDLCNTGTLCGSTPLHLNGQLLCFKCPTEHGPNTCNTITMCQHNEMCYLESTRIGLNGNDVWNSTCMNKHECSNLPHNRGSKCQTCCGTNVCNKDCKGSVPGHSICESNPCHNGARCEDMMDHFVCHCPTGYTGTRCQNRHSICDSNPCQNGARCEDMTDHFVCHCTSGYTGTKCENVNDNCVSNSCVHGTCRSLLIGYLCLCNAGYTGPRCDAVKGNCNPNPCKHGTCQSNEAGYVCICDDGYGGANCDTVKGYCSSSPCGHGGCNNTLSGYSCVCHPGYTGNTCNTGTDIGPDCPPGWLSFRSSCYYFGTSQKTWYNAKEYCETHHSSHLASIDSLPEDAFLEQQCKVHTHSVDGYWVGGTDTNVEGTWVWEGTGRHITNYMNWHQNEPNNSGGNEDCLELRRSYGWIWNDANCGSQNLFICEK